MHEFCDGCAAQYKSGNCSVDLCSCTVRDLKSVISETSHAKGNSDAAGGFIKRQADLAILRGRDAIQNAQQLRKKVFARNEILQMQEKNIQKLRSN